MIISLKSWRTLFRHSQVLQLRRELKQERAKGEAAREESERRMNELRSTHADELTMLRMGFNAHEERLQEKFDMERQKFVDFMALYKFGRAVYAEQPTQREPDMTGQFVPRGHPSRRGPVEVPQSAPLLSEDDMELLKPFKTKEAQG